MNTKTTTYLSTALIVGGFLLIALAWNGAASVFLVDQQIPFVVSGGLTGIGMIMAGCTLALAQEIRKASAEISAHMERVSRAPAGVEESPTLQDTLPAPRAGTGSTIERDEVAVSN